MRAEQAAQAYRAEVRELLRGLAADAGAVDPDTLAAQLQMLYDGASSAAYYDHDPQAAARQRSAAAALVRAAASA